MGQLTGIVLGPGESLYLDSEDLTSAFNLFSVPDSWLPHFAFGKKVDASAFGGTPGHQIRPALSIMPMGWKNAVTLIQAAVREIVFVRCKVPRQTSLEKEKPIPETDNISIVYLDNFDELQRIRTFGQEVELGKASEAHQRFNRVCDELGLGRNLGKQLIMSLTGGIQGGDLNGKTGLIKVARDKLLNFISMSLGLLSMDTWREFHVRYWLGKAAFVAAFKRPLFSILETLFPAVESCKVYDFKPGPREYDEVISFLVLAVQAESSLRAQLSPEIVCTDASPTGGGSVIAIGFKDKSLLVAPKREPTGLWATCRRLLDGKDGRVRYPCPRGCGEEGCSVVCAQCHYEKGPCDRNEYSVPKFGERFSGSNYPLTKVVALAGGAVQKPMDIKIKGNSWDFLTPEGREALDEQERDSALRWRHWGPNCRTFSSARGRPLYVKGKGKSRGPA